MHNALVPDEDNQYRKTYGGFGSSNGDYEKDENLSPKVLQIVAEGNEADIDCIKHELYAHKHNDEVPSDHETYGSDHEDY
jgi:hypothetical protein